MQSGRLLVTSTSRTASPARSSCPSGLKAAGCELDRKVLAQLAAAADPKAFAGLVDLAKQALAQAPQAAPAPAKA